MNITEVLVQPQAMAWLPWAVQYFFTSVLLTLPLFCS